MANIYVMSQLETIGLIYKQIPMPKSISPYEDRPLSSYQLIVKYKWKRRNSCRKVFSGCCMLTLKTAIKHDDELVLVQGNITVVSCPSTVIPLINFVPKEKISSPALEYLVGEYLGTDGLRDEFFDRECMEKIENELFTCNREIVPMVYGYNEDGTLDKVWVNMNLFKPVNAQETHH